MRSIAALSWLILLGAASPPRAPTGHPPDFYARPDPGPFVIFFDAEETAVSESAGEILDTAIKLWPSPDQGRFVLCYNPAEEGGRGQATEAIRKDRVRKELMNRGAIQVLASDWDCYHRTKPLPSTRARMAIIGVHLMDAQPGPNDASSAER